VSPWYDAYWIQWIVQNVLPPSFWTILALTASHIAHRRWHVRQMAQAAMHHGQKLEQADRHAEELKRQLTMHCADLKSHVTATGSHVITSAVPVPQKLLDELKAATKKKPGTGGGGGERM